MNAKRLLILCVVLLSVFGVAAAANSSRIAFLVYNTQDTFMASIVSQMEEQAKNKRITLSVLNAENDQNVQNEQLLEQLESGVSAVIVNAVDRTSAIYLIEIAKRFNTPIILINREPLYQDLLEYDKAFYVGTDPKELGALCGQIIVDYFRAHPEADRNGDGVIQYVLLKGELGHQDAELRTLYSIQAIQDEGFALEKLAEEAAQWERSRGQEEMSAFLNEFGNTIECVLSNNDDMALGAIDTLKAAGYFSGDLFMPVVGVDATRQALEALEQGTLLGTVLNNATDQANAAFELALLLANGEPVSSLTYALTAGKYIWIPGRVFTRDSQ